MLIISVDPSIKDLGWAAWWVIGHGKSKRYKLLRHGNIQIKKEKWEQWYDTMDRMNEELWKYMRTADKMLIELPRHYSGGKGDAAKNSGSILKLMSQVMVLRDKMIGFGREVELISVQTWKGNVDKEVTQKRNFRWYDTWIENLNESDAVGIGDWYFRKKLRIKMLTKKDTKS